MEGWKGGQEYCLNQDYQERQDKIRGFLLFVPHSVRLRSSLRVSESRKGVLEGWSFSPCWRGFLTSPIDVSED